MLDINFDKQPGTASAASGHRTEFNYKNQRDNLTSPPRDTFVSSLDDSGQRNPLIIASLLAIILTLIVGFGVSYWTNRTNRKTAEVVSQISVLETRFKVGDLASPLSRVEATAGKINKFKLDSQELILWPEILKVLSDNLPTAITVNELSFDTKGQAVMRGEAKKFDDLALLLAALEDSEIFSTPKLKSAAFSDRLTNQFIDFSLTSGYKQVKRKDKTK